MAKAMKIKIGDFAEILANLRHEFNRRPVVVEHHHMCSDESNHHHAFRFEGCDFLKKQKTADDFGPNAHKQERFGTVWI